MEIVKKRLSELVKNEGNVRKHSPNQIKELVKSIETFDVIRPIVCDENGLILCGHGLFEALTAKGEEFADCIVKAGLTEKQKKKLMLADNKVYELGSNDYDIIDNILKEFGEEGDFSVPGYSSETLEDLYGIKSVEGEADELKAKALPQREPEVGIPKAPEIPAEPPKPSKAVLEAREKALEEHTIICPHCGGVIEL